MHLSLLSKVLSITSLFSPSSQSFHLCLSILFHQSFLPLVTTPSFLDSSLQCYKSQLQLFLHYQFDLLMSKRLANLSTCLTNLPLCLPNLSQQVGQFLYYGSRYGSGCQKRLSCENMQCSPSISLILKTLRQTYIASFICFIHTYTIKVIFFA